MSAHHTPEQDLAVAAAREALANALAAQRAARGEPATEPCGSCRGSGENELSKLLGRVKPGEQAPPCLTCEGAKEVPRRYPKIVERIEFDDGELSKVLRRPLFGKKNGWVSVRPCGKEYEGKTYLGCLLGDMARGVSVEMDDAGTLKLGFSYHNPAIFVPDIGIVVFGSESWWSGIRTADDLRQITDADISNVWYVKALADIAKQAAEESER